ncbi:hypothetical protein B0A50_04193 [Salinomyces thailandicus]|uniref:Uncharacterized protein n=1 Tax=Salinomyces thailandicus TaxID=706561 RepID=A0A4U0U018_9PEZI|nr:hypothetical protein B0A50_04193 [Salinomyces thailandica]
MGSKDPIHSTGRGGTSSSPSTTTNTTTTVPSQSTNLSQNPGAGNIGPDPNTYTDSSITREAPVGESPRPEFSTGRGGAGNVIQTPNTPATATENTSAISEEIVPETAMRAQTPEYDNFHTGRGGQGNVHRERFGGHSSKKEEEGAGKESLMEKAKHAMGMDQKKKGEGESPLKKETGSS